MNNLGWPPSCPIHCCSVYYWVQYAVEMSIHISIKYFFSCEGLSSFFILFLREKGQHSFLLVELIVALCILVNMWGMKLWCCVQKHMQACLLQTPPSWQEVRHGKRVQIFSVALIGFNLHPHASSLQAKPLPATQREEQQRKRTGGWPLSLS